MLSQFKYYYDLLPVLLVCLSVNLPYTTANHNYKTNLDDYSDGEDKMKDPFNLNVSFKTCLKIDFVTENDFELVNSNDNSPELLEEELAVARVDKAISDSQKKRNFKTYGRKEPGKLSKTKLVEL